MKKLLFMASLIVTFSPVAQGAAQSLTNPSPTPTLNESVLIQLGEQKGQLTGINEHLTNFDATLKSMQSDMKEMRRDIDRLDWVSGLFKFSLATIVTVIISVLVTFYLQRVLKRVHPSS